MTKRGWLILAVVLLVLVAVPTAGWLQRRGSGSLRVIVKNQTSSVLRGLLVASKGGTSTAFPDVAPGKSESVMPKLNSNVSDVVLTDSESRHYTLLFDYEDHNDGSSVTAVVERVGDAGMSGQIIDDTPYAAQDKQLSVDAP